MSDTMIADLEVRAEYVARRLTLLANSTRLLILCHLSEGEMSVGALQAALGIGQSALSQHLGRLREAGMLATRREAQMIYYRIDDPEVETLMSALYDTFCRPDSEVLED